MVPLLADAPLVVEARAVAPGPPPRGRFGPPPGPVPVVAPLLPPGEDTGAAVPAGAAPRARPAFLVQGVAGAGPAVLQIGRAIGDAAPVLTGEPDAEDGAPDVEAAGGVVRAVAEGDVAEGGPIFAAGPPVVERPVAGGVVPVGGAAAAAPSVVGARVRRVAPLLPGVEGPILRVLRAEGGPLLAAPHVVAAPPRVRVGGPHAPPIGAARTPAAAVEVAAVPVLVAHPAGHVVVVLTVRVGGTEQGRAVVPLEERCTLPTADEAGGLVAVDATAAGPIRRAARRVAV